MKIFHMNTSILVYYVYLIYNVITAPQQPEINDQYENTTNIEEISVPTTTDTVPETENEIVPTNSTESRRSDVIIVPQSITQRVCSIITRPFMHFVTTPKVNSVLRNIGTCIVNGAMELVTYYFPAPLIPLIATAAGMIIPFEPVVMLREKMPVTSYRKAFRTAINSFLGTFDRYRLDDEDEDPYMTRRFNRRLMNDSGEKVPDKIV